jgi:hypothetical protein
VKLVTKDYLGLSDDWQQVDSYVEPAVDDLTLRLHQESQVYFYPSDQPRELLNILPAWILNSYHYW